MQKDVVGMHGGIPPREVLPLASLSVKLMDGSQVEVSEEEDVWLMQQYQFNSIGQGEIKEWVKEHVKQQHNPPGGHEILMSVGNTHSISMCFDLFTEPGDAYVCEEFTFSNIIESYNTGKNLTPLPVAMDQDGIIPKELDSVLTKQKRDHGRTPKLLYIITCGQNPTSVRYSYERIAAIYDVCKKHDVLIMEDDPYYYCQFPTDQQEAVPGLKLGPTFLSVDTDTRVIRMDTFSKFLMPGCRMGWVTAHPDIIQKFALVLQTTTVGTNSIGQILVNKLFKYWGNDGFENYIKRLQKVYQRKAAVASDACEKYLKGMVEFQRPKAGMFLWIKMLYISSFAEIEEDMLKQGVVLVPGKIFSPLASDPNYKTPFLRLCFSNCTEENLEEGVRRLSIILKERTPK
eukprot:TRINITY_DN3091_c0_g4_i1.p1 TRINITY_DN3091_c0_g4~~TRINITY_DN3091_c0_g4_i1.p1  ORF type:complete len:459 (+),score=46.77 TRINITY_DN3091_c0_g4_i1:176-1378(+)